MQALGIGFSDIGKRRSNNEDALLIDNQLGLFVVSDGMGGHAGGEVAASQAVEAVTRYIRSQVALVQRIREGHVGQSMLASLAGLAVARANRAIFNLAQQRPELHGMGCTLTVVLVGRDMIAMAHVGDTRLYLERDGALQQLSDDHTVAEDFARSGLITHEQKSVVPGGHHLSRAVGVRETVRIDERMFSIQHGDRLVLCSDGVWGYLEDPRALADVLAHVPAESAAESLVLFANSAGGRDNATALVIEVQGAVEKLDAAQLRKRAHDIATATTLEMPPALAHRTRRASAMAPRRRLRALA